MERLDRAIRKGHSLQLQKRFEEYLQIFKRDPKELRKKFPFPDKFKILAENETNAECPVCNAKFTVLWDWEPDYDVEGSTGPAYIVGAFPDAKCLYCYNCGFYIEGNDIYTYISEDLELEESDYPYVRQL